MKLFKLYTHQKSFSSGDLILNPKEHLNVKLNDVVEIYHPEEDGCRLLLQVTANGFNEELKGREIISVESNIAAAFNLRTYADVIMQVVNPVSLVALDSVEITFKDQYMGRSEMWRLKKFLTNTCVYMNKKIEYCNGSIRCQVYEMWSQGDRVSCGVISEDTKVVFRSSTSMVYLFIQMSSEMWDFDIHGDLYFEKAVNGFLTDLFMKWKKLGSNHEVTIVLFSRTFYAARSLDEFPAHMRDCLQMDYRGRFYEDFYRVAIQNERNDDWSTMLVQLRRLFTSYQSTVLRYHERPGVQLPVATNSTAAQGNFLEVLNISLNVFEKHYLDRSFDRTGQLSVVITPGVGVFEVDRELTNITKQRIIDNGVGSDLVCVGEQPLHAVPLLKFHNKDVSPNAADDYSMPHWINLSFYSTNKKVAYSTFIPRIKLPPLYVNGAKNEAKERHTKFLGDTHQTEYIHNSLFDYDAYDAQIFTIPSAHGTSSLQRAPRSKKTSVPCLEGFGSGMTSEWENVNKAKPSFLRKMSDPDIHHGSTGLNLSASCISDSMSTLEIQGLVAAAANKSFPMNSVSPGARPGRALINPFAPSNVTIKLTSNRRRWTHIFPKGPTGVLIQQHHYQAVPTANGMTKHQLAGLNTADYLHTSSCSMAHNGSDALSLSGFMADGSKRRGLALHSAAGPMVTVEPSNSLTLLWGATGEQEWTPALTTGVDWKSLTIPACLPITTDYFPDKRSLHNDYVVSDYTLLPEGVNIDYAHNRAIYRTPLTTEEVFTELVSQRLAQGFQLIVMPDKPVSTPPQAPCCGGMLHKHPVHSPQRPASIVKSNKNKEQPQREFLVSIGRIFHRITLNESVITVTRYRPRHPYPPINIDYRYRFKAPQHDTYEVSGVNFTTEKLENFNWNYMDQYICTRGDTDYPLMENLKYWRFRMYLLPKEHSATKKIMEQNLTHCDIYTQGDHQLDKRDEPKQQIEEFIRFLEMYVNKIKKLNCNKASRGSPTTQHTHLTGRRHSTSIITRPSPNQGLGNSPFRERVGSNRLPAMRPRSGSKVEKGAGRISTGNEANGLGGLQSAETGVLVMTSEDNEESFLTEAKLSSNATLHEIFEAMRHPVTGVSFLAKQQSLPSFTFILWDAINWMHNHIEGTVKALELLEAMRKASLICHSSGDCTKPIVPGFFLYYISSQDRKSADYVPPLGDLETFENEWIEVQIPIPLGISPFAEDHVVDEYNVPKFLRQVIDTTPWNGPVYKQAHLEVDAFLKSDRIEWGHVRYHSRMKPGHAFEMVTQWLTGSGPIVYDLIYAWTRKALQCGFQMVPVPADPLGGSSTDKSDPLRGPIFVALDVKCLQSESDESMFKDFEKDTWPDRLLLLQEAIVTRFGFLSCYAETKIGSNQMSLDRQYVHCSGNMFILVAAMHEHSQVAKQQNAPNPFKKPAFMRRLPMAPSGDLAASPSLDTYVTRHVNVKCKEELNVPKKVGFHWSWNHMIANKKWKSQVLANSTDLELFQLRILQDFKDFCANRDDRLKRFWTECWAAKDKVKHQTTH